LVGGKGAKEKVDETGCAGVGKGRLLDSTWSRI